MALPCSRYDSVVRVVLVSTGHDGGGHWRM